MYYVYILYLKRDNKLYAGSTLDLRKRLKNHISNKVLSTKNRSPELIHYEVYKCKSDAQRRERFLKTTEGKRLFRQQIKNILEKIKYI